MTHYLIHTLDPTFRLTKTSNFHIIELLYDSLPECQCIRNFRPSTIILTNHKIADQLNIQLFCDWLMVDNFRHSGMAFLNFKTTLQDKRRYNLPGFDKKSLTPIKYPIKDLEKDFYLFVD